MPGLRTMSLEEELDQAEPMASIVAAAHEVCLESRVKSWKQCEQILSSLRRVAVFQDRQWLDDWCGMSPGEENRRVAERVGEMACC